MTGDLVGGLPFLFISVKPINLSQKHVSCKTCSKSINACTCNINTTGILNLPNKMCCSYETCKHQWFYRSMARLTCCVVGEQATRMVLADCRREEETNNYRMTNVCSEIMTLLNQLAAKIVKRLQENDRAMPPLSEDDIMEQLAAQPDVLIFYCFYTFTCISE